MRYQIIHSMVWDDEKFRRLSLHARHLWIYLLTNSRCNYIGLYVMRPGIAMEEIQFGQKDFERAINELIQQEMISWDENCRVLLIKNYLKHNPLSSPTQIKGVERALEALPKSLLIEEFRKHIAEPVIFTKGKNYLMMETLKVEKKAPAEPEKPAPQNDPPPPPTPEEKTKPGETKKPSEREIFDLIVAHWNEICGEKLTKVQALTEQRKSHLRQRLIDHPIGEWPGIFARVARSGFLTGVNDKGWRANFDWVINPNNLIKILEGKYDDRTNINRPKTGMDVLREYAAKTQPPDEEEVHAPRNIPEGDGAPDQDV